MSNVEKLSVSLSEEMAEMLRTAVAEGSYTSSSEVIREALRDWKMKRAIEAAKLERLRHAIDEGLADLEAGRFIEITSNGDLNALSKEVKKRGRELLARQNSE